jgi:hypothetical protein
MKLDDAPVMALPRKLVEQAILGLYDQINLHLVKLEMTARLRGKIKPDQHGCAVSIPISPSGCITAKTCST